MMTTCAMKIQTSWPNPGYWPSAVEVRIAANLVKSGNLTEELITTLATRIKSLWINTGYLPSVTEVYCAAALMTSGYLSEEVLTTLATRIQSSWSYDYRPSVAEVRCAASLVASGYLPEDVMTTLATKIKSLWSHGSYYPDVVEVQCAAALAATGHLISVKYMVLRDLELPSSEDMSSLASRVIGRVLLDGVTGDIGPLLSNLSCTVLMISNMELDQAATSSLVRGLQHGTTTNLLWGCNIGCSFFVCCQKVKNNISN